MKKSALETMLTSLRSSVGDGASPSDAQLLQLFAREQDEKAFAQLVQRHGPFVLQVCRRVAGNDHDADDAFQATFLVLARKASTVARVSSLKGWLHGAAVRVALNVRRGLVRRKQHEGNAAPREAV